MERQSAIRRASTVQVSIQSRTLPKRLPNSAYRVREYLAEKEVDRLIEAARNIGTAEAAMSQNRWPVRNRTAEAGCDT